MTSAADHGASPPAAAAHRPHPLHTNARIWSASDSAVDLWIEVLHGWRFEPSAVLACTVRQDFAGDQFTTPILPLEDIERLYGIAVFEVAIYDALDAHIAEQTAHGNVVLAELDAFHLPAVPELYRASHALTTVALDRIDVQNARAWYYHRDKYHEISGDDYTGVFPSPDRWLRDADILVPCIRCAQRSYRPVAAAALPAVSMELFGNHLRRMPVSNPISAFRTAFLAAHDSLLGRGEPFFHAYAFSVLRQLGVNFEWLADYLQWLDANGHAQRASSVKACRTLATQAMVVQFRLLRAAIRGQSDLCEDRFDVLERCYDKVVSALLSSVPS